MVRGILFACFTLIIVSTYAQSPRRKSNLFGYTPGWYWGLRYDVGFGVGLKVDTLGQSRLISIPNSRSYNSENEDERLTYNWGLYTGVRGQKGWGWQFGFDLSQIVYDVDYELPYFLSSTGETIYGWQFATAIEGLHFAIEKYYFNRRNKLMYLRLGVRRFTYREIDRSLRAGMSDLRDRDFGAVITTRVDDEVGYFITPEIGWQPLKGVQVGLAYHIGLRNMFTREYTHFDNNTVRARNLLQVNNSYLAMRMQVEIPTKGGNFYPRDIQPPRSWKQVPRSKMLTPKPLDFRLPPVKALPPARKLQDGIARYTIPQISNSHIA